MMKFFAGKLGNVGGWAGVLAGMLACLPLTAHCSGKGAGRSSKPLQVYTLKVESAAAAYDEAIAVACLQGLINRQKPELYVLSSRQPRPQYWLDLLRREGGWLAARSIKPAPDLDTLVQLASSRLKGAVIWDPAVPASVNVATTIAGVEDGIVLSPEMAARYLPSWHLPVLADLRGRFTGTETGSPKNDAYRWAIREYLAKGRCSSHLLCLFEDSFAARARGDTGYAVNRDWAVKNRAFVFDLSPWGDERPQDDPDQPLGTDLATYRQVLEATREHSAGGHLTELNGFFVFPKYANMPGHRSAHEPVPTEWETVHLISPYHLYQNTSTSDCFNQSLHSQAPRRRLRQHRGALPYHLEKKTYLCFLMADYDSASVLYDYLPKHWDDPNRGRIPLAWGINPNLLEAYPDLIARFYATLTPADTITADAGAAGYINPSRLRPESLPLFVRHNRAYFREADLTIAPMVLDWTAPSAAVKDAFRKFAPDGFGSMVWDMHTNTGEKPRPHVWKGMPVVELINDANEFPGPAKTAGLVAKAITGRGSRVPGFYFFRIVWTSPTQMLEMLAELRKQQPALNFEVLDVYSFFALYKEHLRETEKPASISPQPAR